jgi:hypothetical protein
MLSAIRLNIVVLLVVAPLELGMVLANNFVEMTLTKLLTIILGSSYDHLMIILRSSYDHLMIILRSSYDHLTIIL